MITQRDILREWRSLSVSARRWLLIGGCLLAGVSLLLLSYEPLLTWFAYRFRVQDRLVQSDVLVLLHGGLERSSRVAELHRQGLAPVILMGRTSGGSFDEMEIDRRGLMQNGVHEDAIEVLPGGVVKSTHDEAIRVRDYVRTHPVRRIILVTTAYHTARARRTFRRVLQGSGVEIRVDASEDPRFTEVDWYESDPGTRLYLLETLKSVYYWLAY
jgi:uncharacterized SAM-binding protein YcdF (DUF218 family)